MKRLKKIIIISLILLLALIIAIHFFLVFKGKDIIIKQIEAKTHKKTTIEYFGLTPILHLTIKGLEIQDLAKVESISMTPSAIGFLTGNIAFRSLIINHPELKFERGLQQHPAPEEQAPGEATVSPPAQTVQAPVPIARRPLRLTIGRLKVKDGKINFIDHTAGQNGLKINIKDINISVRRFHLPGRSVITDFEFDSRIPWQEGSEEGKVELDGWINLGKRDIQAKLKITGIDGIYLYPYYSQWVDLEKARIQSAKLNFTSDIQGLNNDVVATNHLELTDIVRRPLEEGEGEEKAAKITNAVLDIFRALNQGKIVLDFTVHTKMDRPQFGFGAIKMAFEHKLSKAREGTGIEAKDVFMLPGNMLEGLVKGATNFSKAVIEGTVSIGKELSSSVEKTFKKTPHVEAGNNTTAR